MAFACKRKTQRRVNLEKILRKLNALVEDELDNLGGENIGGKQ